MGAHLLPLLFGFPPVMLFLAALQYVDSYKLVRFRDVLLTIGMGALAAAAAMAANGWLFDVTAVSVTSFSRYVAPLIEEALKAAFLFFLLARNRIGFMVDAAIRGFALGAGFSLVENLYYLFLRPDADLYLWVIRGFGTAIMHGGATAVTGMLAYGMMERAGSKRVLHAVPAVGAAVLLHSLFNHFLLNPLVSTLIVLVVFPAAVLIVFRRSEEATRHWLGIGFDSDRELLEMITTGVLSETRIGKYLESLQNTFPGEIVADMLCYLRLHLELSIQAKGLLLMREAGFQVPPDQETKDQFVEVQFLERSIGKTGKLALHPFLHMRTKDLWQITMLQP